MIMWFLNDLKKQNLRAFSILKKLKSNGNLKTIVLLEKKSFDLLLYGMRSERFIFPIVLDILIKEFKS